MFCHVIPPPAGNVALTHALGGAMRQAPSIFGGSRTNSPAFFREVVYPVEVEPLHLTFPIDCHGVTAEIAQLLCANLYQHGDLSFSEVFSQFFCQINLAVVFMS